MSGDISTNEALTSAVRTDAAPPKTAPAETADRQRWGQHDLDEESRLLLSAVPHAAIGAVAETGAFVAVPASVAIEGRTVISGHSSPLEMVARLDILAVTMAWHAAKKDGIAQVTVHLVGAGEATVLLYFLDVRPLHGVLLCLIDSENTLPPDRASRSNLRPRVSVARRNKYSVFTEIDQTMLSILGHTDVVNCRDLELLHPDDQGRALANWMDMLGAPGESRRVRLRFKHLDGHWVWFEVTNTNVLDDPAFGCVLSEMVDISDEMAAQESLVAQQNLLRGTTDALPVGVVHVSADGALMHRNPRLTELVGMPNATTIWELAMAINIADRARFVTIVDEVLRGTETTDNLRVRTPSGETVCCQVIVRPIEGNGAIICVSDETEQQRLRGQLRRRVTHDALTGCLNRDAFLHEIDRLLAAPGHSLALVRIDLDGFKAVNEVRGHAAGDALLAGVGEQLQRALRDGELVARFGGDEFIALGSRIANPEHAAEFAERLADSLAARFSPEPPCRAVASVGVTWVSASAARTTTTDDIVRQADAAMYQAKAEGRGRPVLYRDERRTGPRTGDTRWRHSVSRYSRSN